MSRLEILALVPAGALLFAAVLACGDPAWSMEGTVVDGTGAPVPGATVKVTCPARSARPGDTTNADDAGVVSMGGIPDIPKTCTAEVSAPGHSPRTVPVTDFCFRSTKEGNYGKACGPARVTLP